MFNRRCGVFIISITEEWRDVIGYEGFFVVSTLGRVKSITRVIEIYNQFGALHHMEVKEKLLTQSSNGRYPSVCLSMNGKSLTCNVHRLVLEAFIGPRPKGMVCRHFPDRDTRNNRLDNLRWGTPEENQADKIVHGTSNYGLKHSTHTKQIMSEKAKANWAKRKSTLIVELV